MLPDRGGRETAGRQLLEALLVARPDLEIVAYTGAETASSLRRRETWAADVAFRQTRWRVESTAARVGTELVWLPRRVRGDGVQILHSLGNTAPVFSPVPSVITIHDVHFERFPGIQTPWTRLGLRILVRAAARRATRVICPSEAAKADIVNLLGVSAARIDVVPHGPGRTAGKAVSPDALRRRYGLRDAPLIFCPAVGFEYKNVDRLLTAFAEVSHSSDAMLVQTGWPATEGGKLRSRATKLGIEDRVRFLGWVDDATIEGLYGAATMLVNPSLAEGFGLPVLEAMRRDVPVACSNLSALVEVAGDAAEQFDPYDTESIAGALRRVLSDPGRRRELIEAGRVQAARFSWAQAAEATLAVYERALEDADAGSGSSWSLGSKPGTTRSRLNR